MYKYKKPNKGSKLNLTEGIIEQMLFLDRFDRKSFLSII